MLSVGAQTLLAATVLVLLIACLLWLVFAFGLKLQPRASKAMAGANVLLAGALLLSGLRGELERPWLTVYAADLAGTAAFALLSLVPAWMGEERPPWRWPLTLGAAALLLMPGFLMGWPMRWHASVLYCIQAPLLALATWQAYRLVRSRTRPSFALALSFPLGAVTLLLVARAVEPLLWPGNTPDLRAGSGFNVAWLWAGLVLGMVVNSVVAFLLLAQLILRIRNLTLYDPLTDVLNRRAMGRAMEQAHARWRRGEPYALVLLDMDHFKSLNDSLGHGAGDQALKDLVGALKPCVRDVDALGRRGVRDPPLRHRPGGRGPGGRAHARQPRVPDPQLGARPAAADGQLRHCRGHARGRQPRGRAAAGRPGALPGQAAGAQSGAVARVRPAGAALRPGRRDCGPGAWRDTWPRRRG